MGLSDKRCDSSPLPWPEMFQSAASPRASIPQVPQTSRSSLAVMDEHSFSLRRLQQVANHSETEEPEACVRFASKDLADGREERAATPSDSPPNDVSPALASSLSQLCSQLSGTMPNTDLPKPEEMDGKGAWSLNPRNFQLAIYVAMAHAIVVALVLILYGVWKLLEDYQKPIQWAVLCSMPLRKIQKAMVEFWEKPLKQGMLQTAWAIPAALCKAVIGTLMDARVGLHSLQGESPSKHRGKVGFSTLMQWLVSFAFFTLGYELLGPAFLATAAFVGMLVYAAGTTIGVITPMSGHLDVRATLSMLSARSCKFGRGPRMRWLRTLRPILLFFELVNTRLTSSFVGSLHFVIAVFLISMMIVGSLAGLVLFSYKVGLEGKDAVVALKSHIQKSNYAERIGLKQWIEDYKVPELIDTYAARAYETVSEQIDIFAAQYNLTDLANAGKKYILTFARRHNTGENISDLSLQAGPSHLLFEKLQSIRSKFGDYDFKGVYFELEHGALIILEHLQISREDLIDKTKQLGQRWVDIGKQIVASSSTLLAGSSYFLVSVGYSIASGAAGIIHFMTQTAMFFSMLYYLIVSETGGVMKQVLGMVPLSESMMSRCATVLENTVSNVLLSTAKAAFFQAAFTWLLFRFFNIHFLYMSTLLALFSALLSLPRWFQASSLLAGAELAVEGRYLQSILLMVVHTGVVRYGLSTIQNSSPGHFTGLTLAVGVVLFWPSLEGAIMGPLFITLLIALKNLYMEFVLTTGKEF